MTKDDYMRFCDLWKMAYQMVNAKEPSGDVLEALFNMFEPYPFEMIRSAVEKHIASSEFVIKPVHVFNFIRQATEQSAEQMKNKASKFFDTALVQLNNCDAVIENNYFAYAFDECFGSIKAFFSRPANDFSLSRDRDAFTSTVVNAVTLNLDVSNVPHIFEGTRNFTDLIRVQFCGNYERCKTLAEKYYLNNSLFKGYKIELPTKPSLRIENKQNAVQFSPQQKQNQIALLDNVIKKLTQTQ